MVAIDRGVERDTTKSDKLVEFFKSKLFTPAEIGEFNLATRSKSNTSRRDVKEFANLLLFNVYLH